MIFNNLRQRILKWFAVSAMILWCAVVLVSGALAAQGEEERLLTVHLQGVFSAEISVIPFEGVKAIKPIAKTPEIKDGETVVLKIPIQYTPGEFVLRIYYRAKESDSPYPTEKTIFINKQDIELSIDPLRIHDSEKTKFSDGETENTVYLAFMEENNEKRAQVYFLKEFLSNYDSPESELYAQAVKEFEKRRVEYNTWLNGQTETHHDLYVGRLFRFQYLPAIDWKASQDERNRQLLDNYFEQIDLNDSLIIRSRELNMFMDGYMRLCSMQAVDEESRDKQFIEAGRVACEKASKGDPKVYGWMVDYFYNGYETYGITGGMSVLEKHINNPNCLTSKRQQIIKRLKGMTKLFPGALAPNFVIGESEGNKFELHKWKTKAPYKLLLFWSNDCAHCKQLAIKLEQLIKDPANKEKLDIVAVSLDETETEIRKWEIEKTRFPELKHLRAIGGVNGTIANDYAILSTPVMFLMESESNDIVSIPGNFFELTEFLEKGVKKIKESSSS